ncbi:hypothetical protein HHI36_020466 [Cryptolaemus montrouzieri]|uniref:C2H2-type domain-containing protein n=1 Tax=Cryptolaemus montrouzieri TaxID=559131 RepID=A0ABD2NAF1_9CUCU
MKKLIKETLYFRIPELKDFAQFRGAGGLLLDTGSGPSFLPLTGPVLEQVAAGNSEPGVTTLKLPDIIPKINDPLSREIDVEVCFVCKKCRMAFPGESQLLIHQRQCYSANQENRGAFRIVQTGYECKLCNSTDRYKNSIEFRKHLDSEIHRNRGQKPGMALPPPTESPLSHEMEDVVNQITLLAARAAQESVPDARGLDSNSNNFCQPGDAKRRFLAPPDVAAPPLTSAGH